MNTHAGYSDLDLFSLIEREAVTSHFQPIYSIREKRVVGFEGLSRGIHPATGKLIPPVVLLNLARQSDLTLDLDRLFRKKVLQGFKPLREKFPDALLFLNLEISVLDRQMAGSGHLRAQVEESGLAPGGIAIEIIESSVENLRELQRFVEIYRAYGFLIALDDMGAGHSNLNRVPLIKPDIIKIDRSLVSKLEKDYHRRETFKSMVHLSQKIGAVVLAEGVETPSETLSALELGADLLQGFYLCEPLEMKEEEMPLLMKKVDPIAKRFRKHMVEMLNIRKMQHQRYGLMMEKLVQEFNGCADFELSAITAKCAGDQSSAVALYVLDENGSQLTDMTLREAPAQRKMIFHIPQVGTDHSLRDYFYGLMEAGLTRSHFTSEPYISSASGLFCLTLSSPFRNVQGKVRVLCVDVVPNYLLHMDRIMDLIEKDHWDGTGEL